MWKPIAAWHFQDEHVVGVNGLMSVCVYLPKFHLKCQTQKRAWFLVGPHHHHKQQLHTVPSCLFSTAINDFFFRKDLFPCKPFPCKPTARLNNNKLLLVRPLTTPWATWVSGEIRWRKLTFFIPHNWLKSICFFSAMLLGSCWWWWRSQVHLYTCLFGAYNGVMVILNLQPEEQEELKVLIRRCSCSGACNDDDDDDDDE